MPDTLQRLKAAMADRYTLQRELGRGGMAAICLAEDPADGRRRRDASAQGVTERARVRRQIGRRRWWAAALLAACAAPEDDRSTVATQAAEAYGDTAAIAHAHGDTAAIAHAHGDTAAIAHAHGGTAAIAHPVEPDRVVLRWESWASGMGAPMPWREYQDMPPWSLYGDGLVVAWQGASGGASAPAWPDMRAARLTREDVQEVLRAARDVGLMDPATGFSYHCVADAGTDVITLDAGGTRRVIRVYGLLMEERRGDQCPNVDWGARRRLLDFEQTLGRLTAPAGPASTAYEPEALGVHVLPYTVVRGSPLLGTLEPQPPVAWPLAIPLADVQRCLTVRGSEMAQVRAVAEQATLTSPWTSGGAEYMVVLRPLLPDDQGC